MDSKLKESESSKENMIAYSSMRHFTAGRFRDALVDLEGMLEKKNVDTRLLSNHAVVEFYTNEFKNIDYFKKKFNDICFKAGVCLENAVKLENPTKIYFYYNLAVIYFRSMQYSSASYILHKLFSLFKILDVELQHAVTLLLTEVYLRMYEPNYALEMINAVDNLTQNQNSNSRSDFKTGFLPNNTTESFKLSLMQYKWLCRLCLHKFDDQFDYYSHLNDRIDELFPKTVFMDDDRYRIRYRNKKTSLQFLYAYQECLKGNFKLSVQILSTIPTENTFKLTGDPSSLALYNNLGCIHLYMGKSTMSTMYFKKALSENNQNQKDNSTNPNDCSFFTMGVNKKHQLMYNLGISCLHNTKPVEAFDYLTIAVQVYHMNPRLWLRLAECCIMVHKNGNERDFDFINKRKEILRDIIGRKDHRKLVLNLNLFEDDKYSYDAQSFAIPVATLEFATLCLRNALHLLSESVCNFAPSNALAQENINNLKISVHIASAYVSLCLGDPILALNSCNKVLEEVKCPPTQKFLAQMYLCESLILQDKLDEAALFLKDNLHLEYIQKSNQNEYSMLPRSWKPDLKTSAALVLQYNLAVVLALKGDLRVASDYLKKVWITDISQCDIPVQVIILALYIELSLGNKEIAKNIIMQNCPKYKYPC